MLKEFLQGEAVGTLETIPSHVINLLIVIAIFVVAYMLYRLIIAKVIDKVVKVSGVETGIASFWKYIALAIIMLISGLIAVPFVGGYSSAIYLALGLILGAIILMLILGSKDVLINALSGYALMMYKPFKRGDIVVIDGEPGYVRDITAVYTEVVREDGVCYIPNAELMKKSFTMRPLDVLSKLSILIRVKGDVNVDMAEELIKDAIKQCKEVATTPEPEVYLIDMSNDVLTMQVAVKVLNPRRIPQVRSQILKAIRQSFINAGIQFS
ncbi:MAG: mechanosensitive ion channel family protein [Candidatus Nezhaarchaeales archaeon]